MINTAERCGEMNQTCALNLTPWTLLMTITECQWDEDRQAGCGWCGRHALYCK